MTHHPLDDHSRTRPGPRPAATCADAPRAGATSSCALLPPSDATAVPDAIDASGPLSPAVPVPATDPTLLEHATSFGRAADVYERGRPPYPAEAVRWLLPPGARRVADVGAGTGKLTRQLLDHVDDVVAVEPSDGMRATLERVVPRARSLEGSAERVPLPDDSLDAVFVAQAWHWVDPALAVPEVARVLRPGGTLALLWNVRGTDLPWLRDLAGIVNQPGERDMGSDAPVVGAPFTPVERHDVAWVHELDRRTFVDMVASRSYVITLSDDDRAQVLGDVERLLDVHPDTRGLDVLRLPYVTRCSRAVLGG